MLSYRCLTAVPQHLEVLIGFDDHHTIAIKVLVFWNAIEKSRMPDIPITIITFMPLHSM
jgi:hypothetical protein